MRRLYSNLLKTQQLTVFGRQLERKQFLIQTLKTRFEEEKKLFEEVEARYEKLKKMLENVKDDTFDDELNQDGEIGVTMDQVEAVEKELQRKRGSLKIQAQDLQGFETFIESNFLAYVHLKQQLKDENINHEDQDFVSDAKMFRKLAIELNKQTEFILVRFQRKDEKLEKMIEELEKLIENFVQNRNKIKQLEKEKQRENTLRMETVDLSEKVHKNIIEELEDEVERLKKEVETKDELLKQNEALMIQKALEIEEFTMKKIEKKQNELLSGKEEINLERIEERVLIREETEKSLEKIDYEDEIRSLKAQIIEKDEQLKKEIEEINAAIEHDYVAIGYYNEAMAEMQKIIDSKDEEIQKYFEEIKMRETSVVNNDDEEKSFRKEKTIKFRTSKVFKPLSSLIGKRHLEFESEDSIDSESLSITINNMSEKENSSDEDLFKKSSSVGSKEKSPSCPRQKSRIKGNKIIKKIKKEKQSNLSGLNPLGC